MDGMTWKAARLEKAGLLIVTNVKIQITKRGTEQRCNTSAFPSHVE